RRAAQSRYWPGQQVVDAGGAGGGVVASCPVRAVRCRGGSVAEPGGEQFGYAGDGGLDVVGVLLAHLRRRRRGVPGRGRQGGGEQHGVAAIGGLGCREQEGDGHARAGGIFVAGDDREDPFEGVTGGIQRGGQAMSGAEAVRGRG